MDSPQISQYLTLRFLGTMVLRLFFRNTLYTYPLETPTCLPISILGIRGYLFLSLIILFLGFITYDSKATILASNSLIAATKYAVKCKSTTLRLSATIVAPAGKASSVVI